MSSLPSLSWPVRDIVIYHSKSSIFMVGKSDQGCKENYQVAEIKRAYIAAEGLDLPLKIFHEEGLLSKADMKTLLRRHPHKLTVLANNVQCIFGFIRLLESYHLLIVTKSSVVASVHGHLVYEVNETKLFPVTYRTRNTSEEAKYAHILQTIDFTKGYYFSYTYDLSNSMQNNMTRKNVDDSHVYTRLQDAFVWNYYALSNLCGLGQSKKSLFTSPWVVPIMYGFVHQKTIRLEGPSNHKLQYTLLSRRSRHFAGTRYLRRGSDVEGSVANEVETEQILTIITDVHRSTSLVQVRGSIPLFWSHANLYAPSPGIQIEEDDPDYGTAELALVKHFKDLFERYGETVSILNLVKQDPANREYLLGMKYGKMCQSLSKTHQAGLLVMAAQQKALLSFADQKAGAQGSNLGTTAGNGNGFASFMSNMFTFNSVKDGQRTRNNDSSSYAGSSMRGSSMVVGGGNEAQSTPGMHGPEALTGSQSSKSPESMTTFRDELSLEGIMRKDSEDDEGPSRTGSFISPGLSTFADRSSLYTNPEDGGLASLSVDASRVSTGQPSMQPPDETLETLDPNLMDIRYRAYDFLQHDGVNNLFGELAKIGETAFHESGFFVQPPAHQNGYILFPVREEPIAVDVTAKSLSGSGGMSARLGVIPEPVVASATIISPSTETQGMDTDNQGMDTDTCQTVSNDCTSKAGEPLPVWQQKYVPELHVEGTMSNWNESRDPSIKDNRLDTGPTTQITRAQVQESRSASTPGKRTRSPVMLSDIETIEAIHSIVDIDSSLTHLQDIDVEKLAGAIGSSEEADTPKSSGRRVGSSSSASSPAKSPSSRSPFRSLSPLRSSSPNTRTESSPKSSVTKASKPVYIEEWESCEIDSASAPDLLESDEEIESPAGAVRRPRSTLMRGRHKGLGVGAPCGVLQRGVLRTNCIDCLDRTNIGQFSYAKVALIRQLRALGLDLPKESLASIMLVCMTAWARHGDEMARQYAGSGAMHRVDNRGTDNKGEVEFAVAQGMQNMFVAVQRYASNISTDFERQQAIDLLLGFHQPSRETPMLWDIDARPHIQRYERVKKHLDFLMSAERVRSESDVERVNTVNANVYLNCIHEIRLPIRQGKQFTYSDDFSSDVQDLTSFVECSNYECLHEDGELLKYEPFPMKPTSRMRFRPDGDIGYGLTAQEDEAGAHTRMNLEKIKICNFGTSIASDGSKFTLPYWCPDRGTKLLPEESEYAQYISLPSKHSSGVCIEKRESELFSKNLSWIPSTLPRVVDVSISTVCEPDVWRERGSSIISVQELKAARRASLVEEFQDVREFDQLASASVPINGGSQAHLTYFPQLRDGDEPLSIATSSSAPDGTSSLNVFGFGTFVSGGAASTPPSSPTPKPGASISENVEASSSSRFQPLNHAAQNVRGIAEATSAATGRVFEAGVSASRKATEVTGTAVSKVTTTVSSAVMAPVRSQFSRRNADDSSRGSTDQSHDDVDPAALASASTDPWKDTPDKHESLEDDPASDRMGTRSDLPVDNGHEDGQPSSDTEQGAGMSMDNMVSSMQWFFTGMPRGERRG